MYKRGERKQSETEQRAEGRHNRQEYRGGPSLVIQWIRIRLPMQGTQVRSLVQEDSTCLGATKPLRLRAETTAARVPRACAP